MASTKDLAALLSEASQIYYTGKAFEYQQIKDRQAQQNIEIDRQLQIDRDEKVLAADVLKSELKRIDDQLSSLDKLVIASQSKYQGLTGELINLDELNMTAGGSEALNDMSQGSLEMYNAQITTGKELRSNKFRELNEYIRRISAIDEMRLDIKGGAGGFAGGDDPNIYDLGDFSYQEYIARTERPGSDWLEKGYRSPTPADIMALNTDAISYEKNKAMADIYSNRAGSDPGNINKVVDSFYKQTFHLTQNPHGFDVINSWAAKAADLDPGDEGYEEAMDSIQLSMEDVAQKFDPVGYKTAHKGFYGSHWLDPDKSKQAPYSSEEYVKFARKDESFMDQLRKMGIKQPKKHDDFVERATAYHAWVRGTYTRGVTSLDKMKGTPGLQGSGEDILGLIKERQAEYNSLMKDGKEMDAKHLAFSFRQVSGVDVSNPNKVFEFEEMVSLEGYTALLDMSLVSKVDPVKMPNEMFATHQDRMHLERLFKQMEARPKDAAIAKQFQELLDVLVKKWGGTEIKHTVLEWSR